MRFTRLLAALALAIALGGGTAFAQVTPATTTPGTPTTVPGTPATGIAEDVAAMNGLLLAGSAVVMLAGAAYLGLGRRLFARP